MSKIALITGITGQDGAYLAEFLLAKGYLVHGVKRRASSFNTDRIDHLYQDPHERGVRLHLHYGDLTDATNLIRIVQQVQPDEIYNLAAQSHVAVSFETPEYTANADALGTLRLLEAIRILGLEKKTRFYQASTSEMFGKVQEVLEDLFHEQAIREVPFIQQSIAARRLQYADFDEDGWIKTLCQASGGYSIYEMDGRYLSPQGPVDERVLVIRFIFHNPSDPADSRTDFLAASLEVVNYLVAHRFANELGVEEEIWFLEYHLPQLAIWRKGPSPPPAESISVGEKRGSNSRK